MNRYWPLPLEACAAFLVSLLVGLWYALAADHPLLWDEYYHLLAARSWVESGTLAVGDGAYERGAWFTILVGRLFGLLGESLFVARLPGVITLALWAAVLFMPLRLLVGSAAAWVATLLFCTSPLILVNTVMVRFYAPAGLLFWLGCMAAFFAATGRRPFATRGVLAVTSVVFLRLCYRVTVLARLWIACLALWLASLAVVRGLRSERGRVVLGALVVTGAGFTLWAFGTGWIQPRWEFYREVPAWGLERGEDLRWYELLVRSKYPTLWTLLPVAVVVSAHRQGALTGLSAVTFLSGLAFLSFGGPKAERYAVPIMPFFFVLWGVASVALIPVLRERITELASTLREAGGPRWMYWASGQALLGTTIVFVLATNPGFSGVRHLLRGHVESLDRPGASPANWDQTRAELGTILDEANVVVTTNSVQALYHMIGYDVAFQPWVMEVMHIPEEFGVDPRTGGPVISTAESLGRVVSENEGGVVLTERWRWRNPTAGFPDDVADFIEATLVAVPLSPDLGVVAYRW